MKIKRKNLKRIIESFLIYEQDNPMDNAPWDPAGGKTSKGDIAKSVKALEKSYNIKKEREKTFFETPKEAFYAGNAFFESKGMGRRYSIPELCLLWYQKVGQGKDLHMFGSKGKFNEHPDAEAFKKELKNILSDRFENHSFNVILPDSKVITTATTVDPKYWGKGYREKLPLIPKLLNIASGENKNMRDHVMLTIGSMGVGGKEIIEDPNRVDELIIHPSQNKGIIKFKNAWDFGVVLDAATSTSFSSPKNIKKFEPDNKPYNLIVEIDGANISVPKDPQLSASGLRVDKTGLYKKAKEKKLKAGDKVE